MNEQANVLDRAIGALFPKWGLRRTLARIQTGMALRHYEAAGSGRRTVGWRKPASDANQVDADALAVLRNVARDLIRNNAHASGGIDIIADHVVGWGIAAKPRKPDARVAAVWERWAGTTACDADGQLDFAGLQKLVMRTVESDGECLVRRRYRQPGDVDSRGRELPIPLQIQVLEPDYLDTLKSGPGILAGRTRAGNRIVNGVEFDPLGRRAAYWLFPEHPGSVFGTAQDSRPVPADGVLHVYRKKRAGQVRGVSWLAPVTLKLKDWDEYDDGQLMKQKVAALLAGVVTDPGGTGGTIVGNTVSGADFPVLYPGALAQAPPGTEVKFTEPPPTSEFKDYASVTLRTIATGLGVSYEDLTGDYSQVNFSSARMARLSHYERVHDWRWTMFIPQFCDPVWSWVMEAAQAMGLLGATYPAARWTPPPMAMIEPDKEGLAYQRNIRSGIMTLSEAIRERGYEPKELLEEMAEDNKRLDELGLVLDTDPRKVSAAGLTQARPVGTIIPSTDVPEEPPPVPAKPKGTPPPADDASRAEITRQRTELALMLEAVSSRPIEIHVDARTTIEPGAVSVDARTAIEKGAVEVFPAPVSVDARIMEGAFQATLPFAQEAGSDHPTDGARESGAGPRSDNPPAGHPEGPALTGQQAAALDLIRKEFGARGERPVTAAYVADRLRVSHERARALFRRLYELGYLRGPGSPAYPLDTLE